MNSRLPVAAAVIVLSFLASCTARNGYEGVKACHRSECMSYPESGNRDCVKDSEQTCDEYSRKLGQVTAQYGYVECSSAIHGACALAYHVCWPARAINQTTTGGKL